MILGDGLGRIWAIFFCVRRTRGPPREVGIYGYFTFNVKEDEAKCKSVN